MGQRKEKEPRKMVTEFWVGDRRGSGGYILVNKFEGFIPLYPENPIIGAKGNGLVSYPKPTRTYLDILNGVYRVYLGPPAKKEY